MYIEERGMINQSTMSEFFLLRFSDVWQFQILHFIGFLVFYLLTITGNFLIISAVAFDRHLHTPMYFFLMILAIQDMGQVSVIFPSSMANSLRNISRISYSGCVAQVLFYIFFIGADFFLLTVMAYDRYVAICNPLQYEMVMNRKSCLHMALAVWISSLFYGALHAGGTFASSFCSNIINQFFCDIPQLLKLSCSDLFLVENGILLVSAVVAIGCFIFIAVSYVRILTAAMRFPAGQGRKRAFSTCLPHLTVFSVFVICTYLAYFKFTSDYPSNLDFILTMIYSMVPPLMNPLIYSMRNREIKNVLAKLLAWLFSSMNSFPRLV